MADVYVGIGSNIEPEKMLRKAYHALLTEFGDLTMSPVYQNKAVGFEGLDFLNIVVHFKTEDSLLGVVQKFKDIQTSIESRWGAHLFQERKIDIDILIYADDIENDVLGKKLPSNDIEVYGFVLKPLMDIAPNVVHPIIKQTFQEMWNNFPQEEHPLHKIDFEWNL